jgi:hypothetical protein
MFLWNVGISLPYDTVSYPKWQKPQLHCHENLIIQQWIHYIKSCSQHMGGQRIFNRYPSVIQRTLFFIILAFLQVPCITLPLYYKYCTEKFQYFSNKEYLCKFYRVVHMTSHQDTQKHSLTFPHAYTLAHSCACWSACLHIFVLLQWTWILIAGRVKA